MLEAVQAESQTKCTPLQSQAQVGTLIKWQCRMTA